MSCVDKINIVDVIQGFQNFFFQKAPFRENVKVMAHSILIFRKKNTNENA